jgi:3-oxoacyl-[acyl-carrier protein] reductase
VQAVPVQESIYFADSFSPPNSLFAPLRTSADAKWDWNLDNKMSLAQKKRPGRRRFQMLPISNVNDSSVAGQALKHSTALVTGASRGIGRAIALRFAKLGASVAICGRNKDALAATAMELEKSGVRFFPQIADVTSAKDVAALIANTEAALGPISLLVNNAGIGLFGPVHEKSETDWDRVLNTNLKSVFLVSRAVAPSMIGRGAGDIINISSLAGKNTFAGGGIYCASKWGLQGLSACMAEDLRPYGIRVSLVCPGSVATEFGGSRTKDASKVLLPEDVAHAVAMIATQGPQSFVSEIQMRPVRKP